MCIHTEFQGSGLAQGSVKLIKEKCLVQGLTTDTTFLWISIQVPGKEMKHKTRVLNIVRVTELILMFKFYSYIWQKTENVFTPGADPDALFRRANRKSQSCSPLLKWRTKYEGISIHLKRSKLAGTENKIQKSHNNNNNFC